MATLIRKRMERGGPERRCDGACHHATGPDCNCVCGGRYHGVGVKAIGMIATDYARVRAPIPPDELVAIFDGARLDVRVRLEAQRIGRQS